MLNQPETNSGNCPRKIWRSSINEWHIYTIYTTVHSGDNIVNRHMYQWSNNNWKQCLPMAQAQILHLKSKLMEKAFTWLRDTPASPEDSEHRVKVSSSRQATSLLYLLHSWALQSPPVTELYNLQTAAHRSKFSIRDNAKKRRKRSLLVFAYEMSFHQTSPLHHHSVFRQSQDFRVPLFAPQIKYLTLYWHGPTSNAYYSGHV